MQVDLSGGDTPEEKKMILPQAGYFSLRQHPTIASCTLHFRFRTYLSWYPRCIPADSTFPVFRLRTAFASESFVLLVFAAAASRFVFCYSHVLISPPFSQLYSVSPPLLCRRSLFFLVLIHLCFPPLRRAHLAIRNGVNGKNVKEEEREGDEMR